MSNSYNTKVTIYQKKIIKDKFNDLVVYKCAV